MGEMLSDGMVLDGWGGNDEKQKKQRLQQRKLKVS